MGAREHQKIILSTLFLDDEMRGNLYAGGSGIECLKYACSSALSTVMRVSGSKSSNLTTRSRKRAFVLFVGGIISFRDFNPLTNLRELFDTDGLGKSILLPLKNSPFFCLTVRDASR